MKNEIKKITAISFSGLTALLLLASVANVGAEATKELYSDFGLYSGSPNGSAPMNILKWSGSEIGLNTAYTGVPGTPEGYQVAHSTVNYLWGGWGIVNVNNLVSKTKVARDFSDYAGGHLRFWLRYSAPLKINVEAVSATTGGLVQSTINFPTPLTPNTWIEVVLNLDDLGLNLSRVTMPFSITTEGPQIWDVDHVRWTKPITGLRVTPATVQVNPEHTRQFTVEGLTSAGETVLVTSTFSAPASLGVMTPGAPTYVLGSTLTASNTSGNVTVTALADPGKWSNLGVLVRAPSYVSAAVPVTVTGADLTAKFGLLSETVPGLNLDTDSILERIQGGSAGISTFTTVSAADSPEGFNFFRIRVIQTTALDYSGWAVRWGTESTLDDTIIKDLSNYYEGSLRFWFRGPAALRGKLVVGVRSGNVASQKEDSKLDLSKYTAFDGQWHAVVIPIQDLAKQRPFADISRMKYLFYLQAVGNIGGLQTFDIDNVRWDTQLPSALDSVSIIPGNALIPLNGHRIFTFIGLDINKSTVDVSPTWSLPASLGSLSSNGSPRVVMNAAASAAIGQLQAAAQGLTGTLTATSNITVGPVTYTQSYNVYSDAGSGGTVGVSTGPPEHTDTAMTLAEISSNVVEGATFRRATYTLDDYIPASGPTHYGFALWFTEESTGTRFMRYYQNGYLRFFVRTDHDLQFSIRSSNITAGTELCKIKLSSLGIPLNNYWQEVIVSLADFKTLDPRLDFDQMKNYFTIGALSDQIGKVTDAAFDVDNVQWLTADAGAPAVDKVYQGLKDKQIPTGGASGLIRSYDKQPFAYTYDQALSAMAFTYHKDYANAKRIFDTYLNLYASGGTFNGFYDDYDVETLAPLSLNRTSGPNAWLLLALLHYRNASGPQESDHTYGAMMASLASWIHAHQDPADGGVRYGITADPNNPNLSSVKSTEHNIDCYVAFKSYAQAFSPTQDIYLTYANQVLNWLETKAWNTTEQRFNVGTRTDGVTMVTDKALDVYSWASLALSSYTVVLPLAERDFVSTHTCVVTGAIIKGFDFSGPVGSPTVDKDSVWLEGTAQMAMAYQATGNSTNATLYLNQLDGAVVNTSPTDQGLPYATNDGTAYGFDMTSLNASASSDAWYIFARRNFNPFGVVPLFNIEAKDVVTNLAPTDKEVRWSTNPVVNWLVAQQYIQINAQPITIDPFGIEIYTDNTNAARAIRFVDPTPDNINNLDSEPAGLLYAGRVGGVPAPGPTQNQTLPVAWTIKPTTQTLGVDLYAADPDTGPATGVGNRYQWLRLLDYHSPPLDLDGNGTPDTKGFVDFSDYVRIRDSRGLHVAQGPAIGKPLGSDFSPSVGPNYLYFEGDFRGAAAQSLYQTTFYINFFSE